MTETENLKLSIFDPQDKPKWLVNWNDAMTNIDEFGGRTVADHTAVTASIKAGVLRMDDLQDQIDTLEKNQTATGTDVAGLTNDVAFLQKTVDNYHHEIVTNTNNITANTEGVRDLYNTVNGLNLDVAKLNGDQSVTTASIAKMDVRVTKLEDEIGQVPEDVDKRLNSITASIAIQQLDIEANTNNISGFEMRMDAVEDDVSNLTATLRDYTIYVSDNGDDNNNGETENTPVKSFIRARDIINRKRPRQLTVTIVDEWTLGDEINNWLTLYPVSVVTIINGTKLNVSANATVKFMPAGRLDIKVGTVNIEASGNLFFGNGGSSVSINENTIISGTGTLQFQYCLVDFDPSTETTANLFFTHSILTNISTANKKHLASSSDWNVLIGSKSSYPSITNSNNMYITAT